MRNFAWIFALAFVACSKPSVPQYEAPGKKADALTASQLQFFDYPVTYRKVISYGGEAYSPPWNGNYTFNPGLIRNARGELLASYCRGTSHGSIDEKAKVIFATDNGRSWGNVDHDELMVWDPTPTYGPGVGAYCGAGMTLLRSGRVLFGLGDIWVPSPPSRRPRMGYSDNGGHPPWTVTGIFPPGGTSQTALGGRCFEDPEDLSIWCAAYSRDATSSTDPARDFFYVSTDHGQTFAVGPIIFDGIAQPSGSPMRRNWQEEECGILNDATGVPECVGHATCWMCLIRSYDAAVNGIISRTYSADRGQTWSTPVDVFTGNARPTWVQLDSGAIVSAGRGGGCSTCGVATQQSVMRISRDRGQTWGPEIVIDDTYEVGIGQYVALWSNGSVVSGVSSQQLTQINASRTIYFEVTETLRTPPQVMGTLWSWHDMDPILANYPNHADDDHVSAWPDQSGHGHDLVLTPGRPPWHFRFGETFLHGFDAQPILENPQGSGFQLASPISQPQPFVMYMPVHTWVTQGSALQILDDAPTGNYFVSRPDSTHIAFWTRPGTTVLYNLPANWNASTALISIVFNGANSQVRLNGAPLTVSSGGPFGTAPLTQLLVNGHGGDGLLSDLAGVYTSTVISSVAMNEQYLCLRHKIPCP